MGRARINLIRLGRSPGGPGGGVSNLGWRQRARIKIGMRFQIIASAQQSALSTWPTLPVRTCNAVGLFVNASTVQSQQSNGHVTLHSQPIPAPGTSLASSARGFWVVPLVDDYLLGRVRLPLRIRPSLVLGPCSRVHVHLPPDGVAFLQTVVVDLERIAAVSLFLCLNFIHLLVV